MASHMVTARCHTGPAVRKINDYNGRLAAVAAEQTKPESPINVLGTAPRVERKRRHVRRHPSEPTR
jgi:hypothetical protein